jgi:hypothetical protein
MICNDQQLVAKTQPSEHDAAKRLVPMSFTVWGGSLVFLITDRFRYLKNNQNQNQRTMRSGCFKSLKEW